MYVYDDLLTVGVSAMYVSRVKGRRIAVNAGNVIKGRPARRGDGTLGSVVPGAAVGTALGYVVPRGPVADLQIGAEMKILAKSMIKQIDRVKRDLRDQAAIFRAQHEDAICVGFVGVNFSDHYIGYEGDRSYPSAIPPAREAPEAMRQIRTDVAKHYDELVFLCFRATNDGEFPFAWVNEKETILEYGAALHRISLQYQKRF